MTEARFQTLTLAFDPRGAATITLARAFDDQMIDELMWAMAMSCGDLRIKVIVLACAGYHACDGTVSDEPGFASLMQTVHECQKPVIARVHGATHGVGVGLCCVSDIVLASADARFAVSSSRQALVSHVVAPYLLAALGKRDAQRLALTGELIDAPRAVALQLVSQVVNDDLMDAELDRLVNLMLTTCSQAVGETKARFRSLTGLDATSVPAAPPRSPRLSSTTPDRDAFVGPTIPTALSRRRASRFEPRLVNAR